MSGFMSRIIGKTEGVATVNANVFGKPAALRQEVNVVSRHDTDRGVSNLPGNLRFLQERMPAEARVFLESIARRDMTHAMSEQPTQVTDLLLERRRGRVGIVFRVEQ
jgi:hypothetical protein